MIRFGMHSSLWTARWTPGAVEALVPQAARHGLDVIEIALLAPETIDVEHSRAVLAEHGIAPTCSLSLPLEVTAPLHPNKAEAFLLRALEVAHALGAGTLSGVTYATLGYTTGAPPAEQEYVNIANALRPVARRAAALGMTIGLEPCNRYETHLVNTAEQAVRLIERIGEPNVMIHLDTYHMNIEEKGFAHGIRAAGGRLRYIHLSESHRGVPGTGTVDWDATFKALAETGFDGDMVIESFVTLPPEIARALSVWRPVAESAEQVLRDGVPFL
ncbi:MAG TPA: sugar phosphate isomerase/epimerase, partial [Geminicoccaceae bacterium]|nr:sugar phosphate isomerase/epimerase [Geminicoccaceae bacterium]